VYVSCNPKSLAEDLKELLPSGYRLEAIQPVDLFPQTRHVETVVTLHKVPGVAPVPTRERRRRQAARRAARAAADQTAAEAPGEVPDEVPDEIADQIADEIADEAADEIADEI